MKRIDNKVKLEATGIKIDKAFKNSKENNNLNVGKTAPDATNFKFYSLEEFDNKSNMHLAEFKGVFEKLESFKKTITQKVKSEPCLDFDFDL